MFHRFSGYVTFFPPKHIPWDKKGIEQTENIQPSKNQIGYENYLSKIENIQHRTEQLLPNSDCQNHYLEIEKGWHQRIDKNNRFCLFCPKSIEDEKHFLLQCEIYKILREILFVWAENK